MFLISEITIRCCLRMGIMVWVKSIGEEKESLEFTRQQLDWLYNWREFHGKARPTKVFTRARSESAKVTKELGAASKERLQCKWKSIYCWTNWLASFRLHSGQWWFFPPINSPWSKLADTYNKCFLLKIPINIIKLAVHSSI